jgi:hypothetical protein
MRATAIQKTAVAEELGAYRALPNDILEKPVATNGVQEADACETRPDSYRGQTTRSVGKLNLRDAAALPISPYQPLARKAMN